jgi:hypothetical protein
MTVFLFLLLAGFIESSFVRFGFAGRDDADDLFAFAVVQRVGDEKERGVVGAPNGV